MPKSKLKEKLIKLPVSRLLELTWELDSTFEGIIDIEADVAGARVKPVLYVPEEKLKLVDKNQLTQDLINAGASYIKAPTIHTIRKKVKRDDRHDVELSIEESLEIFAEETKVRDVDVKIAFAAELAREADSGVEE